MLVMHSKNEAAADFVREIKQQSSKWLKAGSRGVKEFAWQQGYGAFSVSPSHVTAIEQYISEQEEHHAKVSFQEEYRRLLKKYSVDNDERFVWD